MPKPRFIHCQNLRSSLRSRHPRPQFLAQARMRARLRQREKHQRRDYPVTIDHEVPMTMKILVLESMQTLWVVASPAIQGIYLAAVSSLILDFGIRSAASRAEFVRSR